MLRKAVLEKRLFITLCSFICLIHKIHHQKSRLLSDCSFLRCFYCDPAGFFGVSTCISAPDEEVRAEFFMEELNNGVKLCSLVGVLQTKVAQSCPSALCQVSQAGGQKIDCCPQGCLWTGTCRLD